MVGVEANAAHGLWFRRLWCPPQATFGIRGHGEGCVLYPVSRQSHRGGGGELRQAWQPQQTLGLAQWEQLSFKVKGASHAMTRPRGKAWGGVQLKPQVVTAADARVAI